MTIEEGVQNIIRTLHSLPKEWWLKESKGFLTAILSEVYREGVRDGVAEAEKEALESE